MILETERLILRNWHIPQDVPDAFAIYSNPEVIQYLGVNPQPVPDHEEMERRITLWRDFNDQNPPYGMFAIEGKSNGRVIGAMIFRELPDADRNGTGDYEIGWHLGQEFWGHGYATEAGAALLAYGFNSCPNLKEILAIAYPENHRSLRVMEKLGLTPLGMTNRYYGVSCSVTRALRPQ